MPLKTVVKVGNISNLSDARYCSGMGVDMLGFRVLEGQENYVTPKLFQEIRGWVTGPKIVAEIYGITSADQLPSITENYAPDYFELTGAEFERLSASLTLPCIVTNFSGENSKVIYAIASEAEIKDYRGNAKLLVKPSSGETVLDLIALPKVSGVALDGTPEVRPGFKDYEGLADILEKLDDY